MKTKNKFPILSNYLHNNGDKEPIIIVDIDGKGRAWVRWKDGFVNMVPCDRLEYYKNNED